MVAQVFDYQGGKHCQGYTSQRSNCQWNTYGVEKNGILLPKLFWCTVRKNCSSDREKLFAKILRSLEHFIQTVKGQNNFW